MRARGRASGGFTLIELMAVIVILGIGVSFTLVRLDGLTSASRLRASARKLAGFLAFARDLSIAGGRPVYVYYDLDRHVYYLTKAHDADSRRLLRWLEEYESPQTLEDGVRFEDLLWEGVPPSTRGIEYISFTNRGAAQSHIIHLKNEDGERASVEVNGLTGYMEVRKGYMLFSAIVEER